MTSITHSPRLSATESLRRSQPGRLPAQVAESNLQSLHELAEKFEGTDAGRFAALASASIERVSSDPLKMVASVQALRTIAAGEIGPMGAALAHFARGVTDGSWSHEGNDITLPYKDTIRFQDAVLESIQQQPETPQKGAVALARQLLGNQNLSIRCQEQVATLGLEYAGDARRAALPEQGQAAAFALETTAGVQEWTPNYATSQRLAILSTAAGEGAPLSDSMENQLKQKLAALVQGTPAGEQFAQTTLTRFGAMPEPPARKLKLALPGRRVQ